MKKYAALRRINLENLYNTFLGLPPRQQTIALAGAIGAAFLVLVLPFSLASGHLRALQGGIAETRAKMGEVARQIDQYGRARAKVVEMEKTLKAGFDEKIAEILEGVSTQTQMKEHVENIKPKPVSPSDLFDEYSVEVKVSRVSLEQLVEFLYKIENAPGKVLRIKRIEIRQRYDNRHLLDAAFDVASFKLTQEIEG